MLTKPSAPAVVTGETGSDTDEHALRTVELDVGGMHCNACALRIEGVLGRREGVASAAVNLATTKAWVTFDPDQVSSDELCAAVAGAGYSAAPSDLAKTAGPDVRSEHWAARAAAAWVLGLAALAVAMWLPENEADGWIVVALAIAVEATGGWPFLRASVRQARHATTSMDTLIAVGTLAALAVSLVETIALGGRHVHLGGGGAEAAKLHGVMAPLIVAILATGRAVEERARGRAARALHSLLGLRPPAARRVTSVDDDRGELVPPESVPVGALVRVRAGETIALDGQVVAGWSAVDESMLTGEPLPVDRGPGSSVTGGTRNGSGVIVLKVSAVAAESVLAGLQRLVDEAQRDKPPLQRLADRISSVFVPVILVGALVTFLAWWLADGNFGTAVLAGIAVLLVACPCAMGLAAPVAMMVGSGRASALGIMIRSGDALERLAKADVVAFDKTGTLTEHSARVASVTPVAGRQEPEVLALAAAVERESEHPIAKAILSAAAEAVGAAADGAPADGAPAGSAASPPPMAQPVTDARELPGRGVVACVGGREVSVLRRDDVSLPSVLSDAAARSESRGETVVVVSADGAPVGTIAVHTPLRPEARGAVARAQELGCRTATLSGDTAAAVGSVAGTLGIDDARSSLTPEGKLAALQELQAEGAHHVAMVGDGINDAPSLAAADVGIAIGSGTEAALASSDVALLGADLQGVPAAIAIARSTLGVIRENFGWAMGYNLSALPLAAAGLLDPLVAAIAMGLSSLVVVLNSLRLTRLGRGGLASVRAPRVTSGRRGIAMSVALPIVLFAGATFAAQQFSPARGQSLLPALPGITSVSFPAGTAGEAYLLPGSPGVNSIHLVFEHDGAFAPTNDLVVTASRNGAPPFSIRQVRLSPGHYIGYVNLPAGTWTFTDSGIVAGRHVVIRWTRTLG
jgi:heavy metal translocating P-type ATPase